MQDSPPNNIKSNLPTISYIGFSIYIAICIYFFAFYPAYNQGAQSSTAWLVSAWNPETDFEHGWMVPLLSAFMLSCAWLHAKDVPKAPSLNGLWLVLLGAALGLLAVRSQQGRIAIGSIPFLLTAAIWCYWGGKMAIRSAFPIFFLLMSIPLPGFQQATVGMQLIATEAAHIGAGLCGVETIIDGTNISSATGNWDTYSIAGGCSGMRSLMALIMISTAWAYLAFGLSLWKRLLLGFSAIPFAICANAFRVASIFVCAEYINPAFAGKTWHDWSGMLFFFPASMLGLAILHGILAGEIPLFKKKKTVIRRSNLNPSNEIAQTADKNTSSSNDSPKPH